MKTVSERMSELERRHYIDLAVIYALRITASIAVITCVILYVTLAVRAM